MSQRYQKLTVANLTDRAAAKIIEDMPLTMTLKVMKKELRSRLEAEAVEGATRVPPE